jgi:5-methylcytosine-specific restriction endonuclease McrA
VQDPYYVTALLRAVVRQHLRVTVLNQTSSRAIPQDVKSAVWNRDGGRCVQCGDARYLEYAHVIPFSKAGATSVENLQVLFRACNLKKGDKQ